MISPLHQQLASRAKYAIMLRSFTIKLDRVQTMDIEQARFNMVEQQIRTWNVTKDTILELFRQVHRENFVPTNQTNQAFFDLNIQLANNQCMMLPKEEARIIQTLDIQPHETILEIGTGSGFMTALLAQLGKQVHSIDIYPEFQKSAKEKFKTLNLQNITLEQNDVAQRLNNEQYYDVIVVTGGLYSIPQTYFDALNDTGRLFCPIGKPGLLTACIYQKDGETLKKSGLFEMDIPHLINCKTPESFFF